MTCLGCFGMFVFPVLGIISLILLVVGHSNPLAVIRWGEKRDKAEVMKVYGTATLAFFLCFIISIILVPAGLPSTSSTPTETKNVAETMPAAKVTKTVNYSEPVVKTSKRVKPTKKQSIIEEPAKTESQYRMNEPFKCGDFRYNFTNAQITKSIGEAMKEEASEGAVFLVVFFTEENMGNKTKTVSNDRFWIVDYKSREYRPASKGALTLAVQYKTEWAISEIQPGVKHKAVTLYEIPEESAQKTLILKIPGGLSNPEITFPLQISKTPLPPKDPPALPAQKTPPSLPGN